MSGHALLSPSSSTRWLACTPSAQLGAKFENKSGAAAEEGTLAHFLSETILKYNFKQITKNEYESNLSLIKSNKFYNPSMQGYCEDYAGAFMAACKKNSHVFIEKKVKFHKFVEGGEGTADGIIITDDLLDFWDLKYGMGVAVSAVDNSQLKLYALGALLMYGFMFDIKRIRLNIYQPRNGGHSVFELTVEELLQWANEVVKPKAALAYEGKGEFKAGEHCRFCPAKATCRALAVYALGITEEPESSPDTLSPEEVADVLNKLETYDIWTKAVKDHAYQQALRGQKWPGYKLVESKTNRAYVNTEEIEKILLKKKYSKDVILTKPQLIGITALEKVLGKAAFAELVGPNIIKPQGSPTLVKSSDKRAEISTIDAAFTVEKEEDYEG